MSAPPVTLRRTGADEIARVLEMEADDGTRCWLGDSSHRWHAAALDDPGREHLLVCSGDTGEVVGFVLLAGPRGTEDGVELRRIVIAPQHRGRGFGRAALRAVTERVFEGPAGDTGLGTADRLWLDVKPGNERALALYAGEGFVRERELPVSPGGRDDRIALVILARHRDRA